LEIERSINSVAVSEVVMTSGIRGRNECGNGEKKAERLLRFSSVSQIVNVGGAEGRRVVGFTIEPFELGPHDADRAAATFAGTRKTCEVDIDVVGVVGDITTILGPVLWSDKR